MPGEGPHILVLTPEGKIHVLTSEHGQTVYHLPHGVWKAVPLEKLYVMPFSTTGTLSVSPECHLFGEVPYVHGIVRDAEHKCLCFFPRGWRLQATWTFSGMRSLRSSC